MAVVPSDFEELKKYNLAEIYEPSPKEQPKKEIAKAEAPVEPESVPETAVVETTLDQ